MRFQTLYEARWIFCVLVVMMASCFVLAPWLVGIWVLLILFTIYFFRDPERVIPADEAAVVAAADGLVVEVSEMEEMEVLKRPMKRVAIFLSVLDVHTNRAPIDGQVTYSNHSVGKFLDARHPDATHLNEYRTWGIENERVSVVVRQITGAIARRIVGWAAVGDELRKGDRFGMIRFGSRTEIYLPVECTVTVKEGDRVQGGSSIIATLP